MAVAPKELRQLRTRCVACGEFFSRGFMGGEGRLLTRASMLSVIANGKGSSSPYTAAHTACTVATAKVLCQHQGSERVPRYRSSVGRNTRVHASSTRAAWGRSESFATRLDLLLVLKATGPWESSGLAAFVPATSDETCREELSATRRVETNDLCQTWVGAARLEGTPGVTAAVQEMTREWCLDDG